MSDSEYSVIKSDVIKSFDCISKTITAIASSFSFGQLIEVGE